MNATVKAHKIGRHDITKVVVRTWDGEQSEVDLHDFPKLIGEYGSLVNEAGKPLQLIGVRIDGWKVVSYANCYWYSNRDGTVKSWHIYVGVSHAPGIDVTRAA